MKLHLKPKPGMQTIRQRFRDLKLDMEEKLQAQINAPLEGAVKQRSNNPWSSPSEKKGGSVRWRWITRC
ncbi:MAG: hypothetical protein GY696_16680 [Gammaproteobacteria bacterium]|nr:hypothetical protein [Gammaproteobacteria bacterium]